MTDLKISQFVDGGTIQDTDTVAGVRAGVNTKFVVGSMAAEDSSDYTTTAGLSPVAISGAASDVSYSNGVSGLTATDVQGAIDELDGSTVTPAALTRTNDTNVTLTLSGAPNTALVNAASITVGWSGILASARGGTNNGFFAVSGPTTTTKTLTIPDANMTITAAAATVLDDATVASMVDTLGGASSSGTGGLIRGTSPTITTPNIVGTSTNNNAAAGSVGEYLEATLASGSATSLTTGVSKTIISVSLTAGDWEVGGSCVISAAASTTTTAVFCATNTVNNTFPSLPDPSAFQTQAAFVTQATNIIQAGVKRYSLASTTTVYFIAGSNFSISTCSAYATIWARRVR